MSRGPVARKNIGVLEEIKAKQSLAGHIKDYELYPKTNRKQLMVLNRVLNFQEVCS